MPSSPPLSPPQVVVVGSFNQDHVWRSERFPQAGETQLGRFSSGPGGKGFNQALACVRQGATTAFIGALGCDALAAGAAALAAAEGLQAHWQRVPTEATGSAAILLDAHGQNMIVVGAGANAALSAAHVDQHAALISAARVLVTQQETTVEACIEAMQAARGAGVLTLHNPAPQSAASASDALLPLADVLTPNESEFAALLARLGIHVSGERLAAADDLTLHRLCRQLGVPTVVLTLGGAGAFVSHADGATRGDQGTHYRQVAEQAAVLDTTGAGDAFNGGLAAALAQWPELPFVAAIRHAGRVAALAVERAGAALAMPTLADVRRRFPT